MERRSFLGALTAASLGVVLESRFAGIARPQDGGPVAANAAKQASSKSGFPQNSTIVLVHGAWADGSCWRNVITPLERRGLNVTCAPLPLTSFADDVAALGRALERTSGPLVLVGHAYSGGPIAAIQEDRVKCLVYVAALAPDEGETVAKVFYQNESNPEAPKLVPDSNEFIWIPDDGFRQAVAHKASTDLINVATAAQRPISVHCIQEPVPAPAWKTKPAWFLIAEEDRMINPKTQHFMADRMHAHVQSHRVDHSPMYSAPNLVIDIIVEAAQQTLSG
jgi:pimeloyl-ACP methyl ester carboxylesterase